MAYVLQNQDGTNNAKIGDIVVTGGGLFEKTADGSKYYAPLNTTTGKATNYQDVQNYYKILTTGEGTTAKEPVSDEPIPTTPTNTQIPQGATSTTFTRNGTSVNGYISNGQTFDTEGNRAQPGDVVTIGGKKYLMTTGGSGMDITSAATANVYGSKDGKVDTSTPLRQVYIVNGTSYDPKTGEAYRGMASEGEVVKAANGKYYNALTGEEVTSGLPLEMPTVSKDTAVQKWAQLIFDQANKEIKLDPTLSWEEALSRAGEQLTPQYRQAMDDAMKGLDVNALKSGFFGQLPTEALKRETAGKLEVDLLNAKNQLASELFGQSEDSAYKKLNAETESQQNLITTFLNLLGIYTGERAHDESRADTAWEQDYKNRELSLASSKAKSSGGSGGGSGSDPEATLTKDEAYTEELRDVIGGNIAPYTIVANRVDLQGRYGKTKYNDLLGYAWKYYRGDGSTADFELLQKTEKPKKLPE